MENETDKNINDLLAMTDFSMNKLFGEPKKEIESPEQFAKRMMDQSGLTEKFDRIDWQIENIKNTIKQVLADCHQNDRTAPNSQDNTKKVVPPHLTEEGTAIARICHICGMPGATIHQAGGIIWTHNGTCDAEYNRKVEAATKDFENNSAV